MHTERVKTIQDNPLHVILVLNGRRVSTTLPIYWSIYRIINGIKEGEKEEDTERRRLSINHLWVTYWVTNVLLLSRHVYCLSQGREPLEFKTTPTTCLFMYTKPSLFTSPFFSLPHFPTSHNPPIQSHKPLPETLPLWVYLPPSLGRVIDFEQETSPLSSRLWNLLPLSLAVIDETKTYRVRPTTYLSSDPPSSHFGPAGQCPL